MTKEDAAIWAGIRHGVKDGLEQALASELMVSTDNDLIREEEVDQVLDCIGDDAINKMATCIKNEHLAIQAIPNGQEINEEEHTINIQKCISNAALEHVEYCVGKLEIQRLGEDAHIYQELYNQAQLKDKEYLYEHPPYSSPSWPGSKQSTDSQMVKATDPLFRPSWYEMHKGSSGAVVMPDNFNDGDLLAKTPDFSKPDASLVSPPASTPDTKFDDFKADLPPTPDAKTDSPPVPDSKPTNSTAPTPDLSKIGSAKNSTSTVDGPDANKTPLPMDDKKDGAADVPLVKRKFGYGPDWETAKGVRDLHPLPRRDFSGKFAMNELGTLNEKIGQEESGGNPVKDDDEDGKEYRIRSSLVRVVHAVP